MKKVILILALALTTMSCHDRRDDYGTYQYPQQPVVVQPQYVEPQPVIVEHNHGGFGSGLVAGAIISRALSPRRTTVIRRTTVYRRPTPVYSRPSSSFFSRRSTSTYSSPSSSFSSRRSSSMFSGRSSSRRR